MPPATSADGAAQRHDRHSCRWPLPGSRRRFQSHDAATGSPALANGWLSGWRHVAHSPRRWLHDASEGPRRDGWRPQLPHPLHECDARGVHHTDGIQRLRGFERCRGAQCSRRRGELCRAIMRLRLQSSAHTHPHGCHSDQQGRKRVVHHAPRRLRGRHYRLPAGECADLGGWYDRMRAGGQRERLGACLRLASAACGRPSDYHTL